VKLPLPQYLLLGGECDDPACEHERHVYSSADVAALEAAYERAMKVVGAVRRWKQARYDGTTRASLGPLDHDEAWELRVALREFEREEKK